jgi:chemotaxis protein CheD
MAGSGLMAKLAGGATVWRRDSLFQVGERNVEAVERLLRQYQIPLVAHDTGGSASRTVTVEVGSGAVVVKWAPGDKEVQL